MAKVAGYSTKAVPPQQQSGVVPSAEQHFLTKSRKSNMPTIYEHKIEQTAMEIIENDGVFIASKDEDGILSEYYRVDGDTLFEIQMLSPSREIISVIEWGGVIPNDYPEDMEVS